jgi:S1-C subfamily serine protease
MLRRYRFVYPMLILAGIASLLVIRVHTPQAQSEQTIQVTAIEAVARHAVPAVVHIEVTERQEIANPLLPFENEPFFKHYFGNPKMPKKFQREIQGLGSGVIIDDSGHILTNYHVVGGAAKIDVMLADGRQFTGKSIKTVGTDPKTDLAVIQIVDKGPFPYLAMGDPYEMAVGQWVVAIGQPRGLSETVTQGSSAPCTAEGFQTPAATRIICRPMRLSIRATAEGLL